MLAAVAQLERDVIDEQMKENKLARWRDGRTIVGTLPFGHRWNKGKQRIEVVPKEARMLRRVISLYLDQGKSFNDIAIQLTEEGVRFKKARLSSAVISYMLKNPIYYGHYVVNQIKYKNKNRTKEKKPNEEHITLKVPHPIISKTLWDQIQKKTQFNKVKGKRITIAREYFLRDVLICGECGAVIKPRHGNRRKDGTKPRYYSCFWRGTSEKQLRVHHMTRCHLPYINAEELERYI